MFELTLFTKMAQLLKKHPKKVIFIMTLASPIPLSWAGLPIMFACGFVLCAYFGHLYFGNESEKRALKSKEIELRKLETRLGDKQRAQATKRLKK